MTKTTGAGRWRFAVAVALVGGLSSTSALRAQVLTVYEPFAYPAGMVNGQDGGTNWSGAWSTTETGNNVTAGGLTFGALSTTGGGITTAGNNNGNFRTLTVPQGTPGTTSWISFLTNQNSGTTFANAYNGISLFQGSTEQLFMGQPFNSGQYGLQQPGSGEQNSTTDIDGTTRFLVFSIDFGMTDTTINMFVDPTPGAANPDVAAAVANYTGSSFGFDNIRIQGGLGSDALLNFDELRIGDSFGAVSPVPEPGSMLLMGAAGVGLAAVRRSRNKRFGKGRASTLPIGV